MNFIFKGQMQGIEIIHMIHTRLKMALFTHMNLSRYCLEIWGLHRELQPKKVLCEILSLICLKQQLSTLKEMNCCLMINRCENCSTERRTSHPRSSNFNSSLWIPCELEFRHCTAIADPFKKHLYIYFVLNICVVMHEMCRLCVRQYTLHLSTPAPL